MTSNQTLLWYQDEPEYGLFDPAQSQDKSHHRLYLSYRIATLVCVSSLFLCGALLWPPDSNRSLQYGLK
ncbi:hypothetical protein BpHYR1_018475 [Brachionus plicatilis]|uniref:Uncharacterized protein n=1 Tax=Brachionus plicatilis TaxID=10195 RepID=A0A3M7Q3H2_BRAPC|nr:hypothetical protein BpHYR1_018475 [Brachionus plicatilis]